MSIPTNLIMGLSEKEAQARIRKFGKNVLVSKTGFIFIRELFASFFSPLILLLLGASLISAFLGDIMDFFIIFGIVLMSGLISFVQHFRAERASQRLKNKVVLTATVIRDGEEKEIPFSHVTIGDIVLLSVGDIVPADVQLAETTELSIDESTLTGESYPAEKDAQANKYNTNRAFAGTHVVTGKAKAIVIEIGKTTQLGKLSEKIAEQKPKTAFDKELESFSLLVIRIILILCAFVFLVNAIFHHNFFSSFLFAVALAVGLTPELMPVVITVSLSSGALKMEAKEVIVKFLPSIQNLGSMDTLCMDKTGTLTENNITLSSYEDFAQQKNDSLLFFAQLNSHLQSGYKNPLDKALLANTSMDTKGYTKVNEIPFDFERKMLSVIVAHNKSLLLVTKGAPQKVLDHVYAYQHGDKKIKLSADSIKKLRERADSLAQNGFRVIAIATKEISKKDTYAPQDESQLIFFGFIAFADPVKKTVSQAIKKLLTLGISPKILTGDNAIIAEKTCLDAGIAVQRILDGTHMQKMSQAELEKEIEQTTIFANLSPEQKATLIQLFKKRKHIVGFLGDGINDAPPLKAADVGISVNNGSDIAKDVADIILMRKSLNVLADGVIEGRKTYANTFKYILMSLSSNFGNMMSVAIASLFLPFLPLLPVQIILIDFLYDLSQISVPLDTVDQSALLKPQQWSISFLKKFTIVFGPLSSIFDITTFAILLFFLHASVPTFRTGWFIESFLTQTLIIFAIRTQKVPFFTSMPAKLLVATSAITIAIGVLIVFTPIGAFFTFTKLPFIFWPILFFEVLFYFTCVELMKLIFYKKITATL